MDGVVQAALGAIDRRDWATLRLVLHPYMHWEDGDIRIRGRTKVLMHLSAHPVAGPPESYELRDGQIYRWTAG